MNKTLAVLKTIKPTKTNLLVAAAALVVLALLSFATVKYVQDSRNDALRESQAAAERARVQDATNNYIKGLEAQNASEKAKREAVCNYVRTLATARNTRTLVTVPVVPCS